MSTSSSTADLTGKTALVTGASRGIGRATAKALAAKGARVIVHFARNAAEADTTVEEIRAGGGRANAVQADLAAANGPHTLAAHVQALIGDRLDIFVANAGVATFVGLEDQTVADFDYQFALNVRAPFFLMQQLLPLFGEGSSVILLSSVVASSAVGVFPAYAATKGSVDSLTLHFAQLLGPRGIRVNAVAPGAIETELTTFLQTEAGRDGAKGHQALKRIGQPDDVADVIAFLASDQARWVTGEIIRTSGGANI